MQTAPSIARRRQIPFTFTLDGQRAGFVSSSMRGSGRKSSRPPLHAPSVHA
ncbi:MAG: hypothetical protein MZV70_56880 [Desulfobacterales bacterium]|nr:hypothetical protein [Desulfobacterales bacterium]